jgi:hypothetical protein
MRQIKVLAVVLIMSLCLFAAESPFSGTWKLNLAKSKLTPPVPKSDIAVVDADENGLKLNQDVITDKGESLKISYEAKFERLFYTSRMISRYQTLRINWSGVHLSGWT